VLNCDRSTVKHALQNTQNDCYQWLSNSRVHQIRFRPDPAGELTVLPQTPSWFKGPTSKGRERKGRERRGEEGGEEVGEGQGTGEWKGRGIGMPRKGEGTGREGRKKERRGMEGKGRKVRTPLRQFLPTPLDRHTE